MNFCLSFIYAKILRKLSNYISFDINKPKHFFFFFLMSFIYWKGRVSRERKRESPIHWFIHHMAVTAGSRPGGCQEPETVSCSSKRVAGSKCLGCLCCLSSFIDKKLYWKQSTQDLSQCSNMRCRHCKKWLLTCCPTVPAHMFHILKSPCLEMFRIFFFFWSMVFWSLRSHSY